MDSRNSNVNNSDERRITELDILGIARIPITVRPGECVKELRDRLAFAPGLRVLHDGELLKDSALVPANSSVMLAPGVIGGGGDPGEGASLSSPSSIKQDKVRDTEVATQDALLGTSATSTKSNSSTKSTRCTLSGCEDRPARIVGDCRYCGGHYCSRHRLPEAHLCDQIEHCRQQSLAHNTEKLMSGKCVADKM